jgi:hypothetical protein
MGKTYDLKFADDRKFAGDRNEQEVEE